MSWTLITDAEMGKHLKVRQHKLDNGLTLISCEDHSAPIVAYQTWFAVGSRDEKKGATGMAHLFEHLMFNQTKGMALGEFDRRIESTGGDSNAATWTDWTYYRNNIPAKDLKLIVSLEAERMTDLVLMHNVVEAEREVVMNERLERVDDDIDGFASEELFRRAFQTHPYHWPTIGWMQDIQNLGIPDIERFYRDYYAPDNATLVVVGDFREEDLLAVIEKQYGGIPAAGQERDPLPSEPTQIREQRFDYEKEVSAARLLNGYKGPGQLDDDWAAVSFTCQLLAGSASSPLYQKLVVDDELASSLFCDVMPFADPSLIEIATTATRGTSLDTLQDAIDSQLEIIARAPPSDAEISKNRNLVETEFWAGLSSVDGKAEALGHYQCVHGDFRELFSMAKRLANVSPADVHRVLNTYFKPSRRTIIRIEPEAQLDRSEPA